jgi:hypothetical protein
MNGAAAVFLFCVLGIIIDSVVIFGTAGLIGYLPPGNPTQQVSNNLIIPLEVLDIVFVIGAIVSGYAALKSS